MNEPQVFDEKQMAAMAIINLQLQREKLRLKKKCIKAILEYGESCLPKIFELPSEYLLFDKASIDRWIRYPLAAKEEIKRTQAEIVKIYREIKSLKATIKKDK